MMLTDNWNTLSPHEKYEERFKRYIAAEGVEFATPEAEKKYKKLAQMMKDTVDLKIPERVPVGLNIGFYGAEYAGITAQEAMYDYDKMHKAWVKLNRDFEPDFLSTCMILGSGKLFETLDYKLYNWPGHGCNINSSYQCVEKKYMLDNEYDELINDPSGFFMRNYLPRVLGALEPWSMLSPFTDIVELPFVGAWMIPVGTPPVQESFKKLLEAGQAAMEWAQAAGATDGETISTLGLPSNMGGFTKAPFDTLGDTLRGTKAIMLDLFRRPDKVIEAADRLVAPMIDMGVRASTAANNPMVMIPLHKGADGFLSNDEFAKFYWPSLKAVLIGLTNEGCVPFLFVEGSYNERLEFLADPDLPKGQIIWYFDRTDMKRAKETLGGIAAISGNVPAAMLKAGTPEEVDKYVKNLIEDVAEGGGFILNTGAVIDQAKAENLHAMVKAGRKYGVYR